MDYSIKLRRLAKDKGLTIVERPNGHYQIIGEHLLVNYYPDSKRRTAYVGATSEGIHNVTPEKAIYMALTPPKIKRGKVQRKHSKFYKKHLDRMWAKDNHCYWCHEEVFRDDASVDHRIPLKRGGLDNPSNFVLAHKSCNHERGHNMPEISISTSGFIG